MLILKDTADTLVTHCGESQTVLKTARQSRQSLFRTYSPEQLVERESRALNLLAETNFAPRLISACGTTLKEQSFVDLPTSLQAAESASEIIENVRGSFDQMAALGVLKIGVHHSEIFWNEVATAVHIVDYGEVVFADEFPYLHGIIKKFNQIKFALLERRMKRSP